MHTYWRLEGRKDALLGSAPKTWAFFSAAQIVQCYESYMIGYRSGKKYPHA